MFIRSSRSCIFNRDTYLKPFNQWLVCLGSRDFLKNQEHTYRDSSSRMRFTNDQERL